MRRRSPAFLAVLLLACAPAPDPTEEAKMRNPEWVEPEFLNDGGPMMVLSRHLLDSWRGSPPDDAMGGDYGRAVSAPDGVAAIPVGTGAGVVFGNSPDVDAAQWLRDGDTWIAVGWSASDDGADEELSRRLVEGRVTGWKPVAPRYRAESGLVLFHPACAAEDFAAGSALELPGATLLTSDPTPERPKVIGIGCAVVAPAADGTYAVEWTEDAVEDLYDCVLVRFRPAGSR